MEVVQVVMAAQQEGVGHRKATPPGELEKPLLQSQIDQKFVGWKLETE
jgi:hypothetical protein